LLLQYLEKFIQVIYSFKFDFSRTKLNNFSQVLLMFSVSPLQERSIFPNQHVRGITKLWNLNIPINSSQNNDVDFLIGETIVIVLCLQRNQRATISLIPLVGIS